MLGAFAPLPLRLSEQSITASQHARLAADLAAVRRTAPLAIVTIDFSTQTVIRAITQWPVPGGPTGISTGGTGLWAFDMAPTATLDDGRVVAVSWTESKAYITGGGAGTARSWAGPTFGVVIYSDAGSTLTDDREVTCVLYGQLHEGAASVTAQGIGVYGGSLDKQDCWTEREPYAWGWYRELQEARGSAYTRERGTMVHAENLALARSRAAIQRAAEKLRANSTPDRADEKLAYWEQILRPARVPGESRADLRRKMSAQYQMQPGGVRAQVKQVLRTALGSRFIDATSTTGATLASPPTATYWPGVNPGLTSYDLSGSGAWCSERATLRVQLETGISSEEALQLRGILASTLDRLLPASASYDWYTGSDGWLLGEAELGYTGL